MQAIEDIKAILLHNPNFDEWDKLGYIQASTDPAQPALVLLNYTREALYAKRWTPFERVCRGLILDRTTQRVVALPFPKFFNYGEAFPDPAATLTEVWEKVDGSLGIGYHYEGQWHMASRGSLTGEHALWGTAALGQPAGIDPDLTLLFEMILPESSRKELVVKYDFTGLVLLAARHRVTGEYLPPYELKALALQQGWRIAEHYINTTLTDVLAAAAKRRDFEGWVVVYNDGSRFKIKTADYLKAAYLNAHFNRRIVWRAALLGETLNLDPDVQGLADQWLAELDQAARDTVAQVADWLLKADLYNAERKQAAMVIQTWQWRNPERAIAFKLLDNKDDDALRLAKKSIVEQES